MDFRSAEIRPLFMEVRRGLFRTLGGVRFAVGSMKMLLFPASGRFSFFENNFFVFRGNFKTPKEF